jgi:hypothetical protein
MTEDPTVLQRVSLRPSAIFPKVHRRFGIAWSCDSSVAGKLVEDPSDRRQTLRQTARTFVGSASTWVRGISRALGLLH